ncbi:MAG: SLBB domain-containing protein [Cyanobacteriota bacterium]
MTNYKQAIQVDVDFRTFGKKLIQQAFPLAGGMLLTVTNLGLSLPAKAQLSLQQETPLILAQATPEAYTLGAGDMVRVDVFNVPEYSGEFQVLVDGTLNLPLVGALPVQGLTLAQVNQLVSQQYSPFLKRPIVTVSLLTPRPVQIAIAGEVNRPGSYTIPIEEGKFPSVTDAIKLAGGITRSAAVQQVQLRRQLNGQPQMVRLDLMSLLNQADLRQDVTLRDGDTLYIPTSTAINPIETRQLADANIAPQSGEPLQVSIVGEVTRPGSYTIQGQGGEGGGNRPTLTEVIKVAGGVTPSADIRRVTIRRPTRAGVTNYLEVDLSELLSSGDLSQDILLQEGDTIQIATATDINPNESRRLASTSFAPQNVQPVQVAIVGEVKRPGSYTLSSGSGEGNGGASGQPVTLTQAIQTAGGIKPMADVRNITVRRSTNNGTEKTIDVNLWELLRSGDLSQDVILQEGDTIEIATATQVDPGEATALADASFSPSSIAVNVVGEVKSPGTVQVPPNTPLNQVLLAAGGFDAQRANKGKVELVRLNPNGTVTKRDVDIDLSDSPNEETNPILRNGDVVVVERSGLTRVSDTLGTILRPVGSFFSLFNFLNIFGD